VLHTDASGFGIGAVLLQRSSGTEQPIAYASRSLSKAEQNYSTTERECLAIVWAVQKFRPYLYGRHFIVMTDHHSLCWLQSLKDPTSRLARWSLRLQDYQYDIVCKSGKQHQDANALSRNPVSDPCSVNAILQPRTTHDLRVLRLNDPFCAPVLRFLEDPTSSLNRTGHRYRQLYEVHNGLLYRRSYVYPSLPRFVVPQALKGTFLDLEHNDPSSGHLGFAKTFNRMHRKYFWPKMQQDILQYTRSCSTCHRFKGSVHPAIGHLQSISPPSHPFDLVGIDFLGPFPFSLDGNRYIIVSVDYLTRYAETCAVTNATAASAADFYVRQLVLRHGAPERIITDRGTPFVSRAFRAALDGCSTIHSLTTAYHPQSNGLTERFNQTLTHMLACYVNSSHTNWDR